MNVAELLAGPPGAYAGIGSRETPPDVLALMRRLGRALAVRGYRLRSGCAPGADSAFENGAGAASDLFLPWSGFRGRYEDRFILAEPTPRAYEIASAHHPAWARLSRGAQALQARNTHQVLGADCASPSKFVLCWTADGATTETSSKTGGTGQALRVAKPYDVPVWNLQRADHRAEWELICKQ
jgi:hypothetical protein